VTLPAEHPVRVALELAGPAERAARHVLALWHEARVESQRLVAAMDASRRAHGAWRRAYLRLTPGERALYRRAREARHAN
jgi:hypothetical protein